MASYPAWYAQPEQDPYQGAYTDVCLAFDPSIPAAPTPAALLTRASTGPDLKAIFVILCADHRIHVLHRVIRQLPALGMPPSPFDNTTIATLDDLTAVGPTTVTVPADLFNRTIVLHSVRSAAAIDADLAADPAAQQLPVALAGADVSDVRTRGGMFVPPAYASRVLTLASGPGGLSPRQLWVDVITQLRATAGHEAQCASFVSWSRVAVSHGVEAANPLSRISPVPVIPDLALAASRFELLRRDLPQRFGVPAADLQPVVQQLGALRADTAAREVARETARLARETAKKADAELPSLRWRAPTVQLLNLCQVGDENLLPDVWKDMARAGVKQDRQTIQYHLRSRTSEVGSRSTKVPIVSPELAREMGSLTFEPTSRDDLKSGLSIFAVCHPDQASAHLVSEMAGHYDNQMSGATGLTLTDQITLKAAQELKLPSKYLQVRLIVAAYHTLLETSMGIDHDLVLGFGVFLDRMGLMELVLDAIMDSNVLACAGFLRFLHLKFSIWFAAQVSSNVAIPIPAFGEILDRIEEQTWVPVALPLAYLKPQAVQPGPRVPAPLGPSPSLSATNTAVAPTPASKRGFFKAPAAQLAASAIKTRSNFNINAHITAHGPPPLNDAGGLMCLSFHFRGGCRHECERGSSSGPMDDHKQHNASETQRLVTYLNLAGPTTALGNL